MPRRKSNGGGRRFDTSLSFIDFCKKIGINPRQRIIMMRYLKQVQKRGEQTD